MADSSDAALLRSAVAQTQTGVVLSVYAKPRASKSKLLGVKNGALEVAVAAPPVDGEANAELLTTLAAAFGVAKRNVRLLAGQTGKHKRVEIDGLTLEAVAKALA